jgi:hypothetical protein
MIQFYTDREPSIKATVEIDPSGDLNLCLNGHRVLFINKHLGNIHRYPVSQEVVEELSECGIKFKGNEVEMGEW